VPGPDAVTVGDWAPVTLADLTAHRRQLATVLREAPGPPGNEGAERLLLAFEELVSNALRHGRAPVRAAVTAYGGCWLVEVSDAAADRPPTPAQGRDAAQGGLGLPLVAQICAGHGWQIDGDRKNVWACVDHARGDVPREGTNGAAHTGGRPDRSPMHDPAVAERLGGTVAGFTGALGFAPTTRLTGPVGHLPRDLVTNLLAAVVEALTNVARHAHAQSVAVDVAVTGDAVTARVSDDGIGLACAPRDAGLADLARRAAWYGGTLTVGPGPHSGTRLTWTVPHPRHPPASG
jgi:signal transduction histidine kinase